MATNKNALDRYQEAAGRTRNANGDVKQELANYALGLTGESGEVADIIKKFSYHGHKLDHDNLVKELGDVLWYLSNMASIIGVNLSDVAGKNIEKLKKRYPDGFSTEASQNRTE